MSNIVNYAIIFVGDDMKKSTYFFIGGIVVLLISLIVLLFQNNVYQVVFAVDGEPYKTIEVRKNATIKENIIPEKEGQVFIGWYDQEGNLLEEETTIQKDTVYYARWGIISEEE